jgi:hypothetical protein
MTQHSARQGCLHSGVEGNGGREDVHGERYRGASPTGVTEAVRSPSPECPPDVVDAIRARGPPSPFSLWT